MWLHAVSNKNTPGDSGVSESDRFIQLCACRNVRVELQKMQLFFAVLPMDRRKQHAAGFDAHHGTRGKVHDRHTGLSDELFRFIEGVNA